MDRSRKATYTQGKARDLLKEIRSEYPVELFLLDPEDDDQVDAFRETSLTSSNHQDVGERYRRTDSENVNSQTTDELSSYARALQECVYV